MSNFWATFVKNGQLFGNFWDFFGNFWGNYGILRQGLVSSTNDNREDDYALDELVDIEEEQAKLNEDTKYFLEYEIDNCYLRYISCLV